MRKVLAERDRQDEKWGEHPHMLYLPHDNNRLPGRRYDLSPNGFSGAGGEDRDRGEVLAQGTGWITGSVLALAWSFDAGIWSRECQRQKDLRPPLGMGVVQRSAHGPRASRSAFLRQPDLLQPAPLEAGNGQRKRTRRGCQEAFCYPATDALQVRARVQRRQYDVQGRLPYLPCLSPQSEARHIHAYTRSQEATQLSTKQNRVHRRGGTPGRHEAFSGIPFHRRQKEIPRVFRHGRRSLAGARGGGQ